MVDRDRRRRGSSSGRSSPCSVPTAGRDGRRREPRRRDRDADWAAAHDALVGTLRDLIRIPSINPPDPAAPGRGDPGRRYLADRLTALGLRTGGRRARRPVAARSTSACAATGPAASRSCCCRTSTSSRRPPERWTHDPFAADIADGYVYGRGAVDMKGMIALELGVIERLVDEARAAGRDPARDPIPGLRRDVLFTCAADEEAGSIDGARWFAAHRPDWLRAAGAVNECGGVSVTVARPAAVPDPGRREGLRAVPDPRHGHLGPRLDAARRQRRGHGRRASSSGWPPPARSG